MPKHHALLSASASRRWLNCTPSAVLESHEPDTSSPFAEEGTRAHALAEKKLKAWIKSNRKTHFKADDGEMQECTDGYRDYVIEIFNDEKKRLQMPNCASNKNLTSRDGYRMASEQETRSSLAMTRYTSSISNTAKV